MKKNTGYTLLELMVTLAVAAVLLSVGVPQLSIFFQSNRMVTNTNDLVTAMRLARSEAIRRGVRVTVCESDAATTAPECDNNGTWEKGWIVFAEDTTGAGAGNIGEYEPAANDFLIRAHGPVAGNNVTVRPQQADITNYVSFTSKGVPKDASGSYQTGVFSICDSRGMSNSSGTVVARGVELNAAGDARATDDAAKIVSCP